MLYVGNGEAFTSKASFNLLSWQGLLQIVSFFSVKALVLLRKRSVGILLLFASIPKFSLHLISVVQDPIVSCHRLPS